MVFPIKQKIEFNNMIHSASGSGLDLLFAASQFAHQDSVVPNIREEEHMNVGNKNDDNIVDMENEIHRDCCTVVSASTVEDCGSEFDESSVTSSSASHHHRLNTTITSTNNNSHSKSFPETLHAMLSNPDHSSSISWLPHGKSFVIHKPRQFASQVLPIYFRKTRLESFIRKLNRWGFRRVKASEEAAGMVGGGKNHQSSFAHKHFLREDPMACVRMHCNSKPAAASAASARSSSPLSGSTIDASDASSNDAAHTKGEKRSSIQIMEPYGLSPSSILQQESSTSHDNNNTSNNDSMKTNDSMNTPQVYESQVLLEQMQRQIQIRSQVLMMNTNAMTMNVTSQVLAQRHFELSLASQRSRAMLRNHRIFL